MSKYYSMLFIWSKGAKVRRRVLEIIYDTEQQNQPIFLSEITKIYNSEINNDPHEQTVTISTVRNHIKILLKYNLITQINKGGRPEYLQITEEGKSSIAIMKKDIQQ